MQGVELLREAGWVGWVQLFLLLAGTLWALVCAVLLGLRWRVPPFLAAAPLAMTPLVGAIGASVSSHQVDAAVRAADASQRATLLAAGMSETLSGNILLMSCVPAALLLGIGAAAGGARPPRGFGAPVVAFLLLGLVSLLPLADFAYGASVGSVLTRVLLYGLGVLPVVLSLLNNGMQTNGREASVTASMSFFAVVAATETAVSAMGWSQAFGALANVDPSQKAAVAAAAAAELGGANWLANLRLGLALLVVVLAAFRPVAQPTEEEILAGNFNPSPFRTLGTILALGIPLLWIIMMVSADPSDTLTRIMTFWSK